MVIYVTVSAQLLTLKSAFSEEIFSCLISTAKAGFGQNENSFKTPLGQHEIAQKIGGEAPEQAVFSSRVPTGEIYTPSLLAQNPDRDWILTRILWLRGLERGKNLGPGVDSYSRYIYLHGTSEEEKIGTPSSHGCIRMKNADIMKLYDLVTVGTRVTIVE